MSLSEQIKELHRQLEAETTPEKRVDITNELAVLYVFSKLEQAMKLAEQALQESLALNYQKGIGVAQRNIGEALLQKGNYRDALAQFQLAADILAPLSCPEELAYACSGESNAYWMLSEYDMALKAASKGISIMEDSEGDPKPLTLCLNSTANAHRQMGNWSEALECLYQCEELLRESEHENELVTTYANIGAIEYKLENFEEAITAFRQGLDGYRRLANRQGEAVLLSNLGAICFTMDDYAASLDYYAQAKKLFRQLGNQRGVVLTAQGLGTAFLRMKGLAEARKNFTEAHKAAAEMGDKVSECEALVGLADVAFHEENFLDGHKILEEASGMAQAGKFEEAQRRIRLIQERLLKEDTGRSKKISTQRKP